MDKRRMRERMRRKRRQMMIRKFTKLGIYIFGAFLVVFLAFKLVINPIVKKVGNKNTEVVEVQAETVETDPTLASRMPLKSASSAVKAANMTPGWQQDDNGYWYQNADGSYYAGGVMEIDGQTYAFDENGYRQTGWVEVDGVDKMFSDDGTLDPTQSRPMVALTFDDGPGEYTDRLLDYLEENDAVATFFMLGQNMTGYESTIQRMADLGCELGNHSYDHANLATLSSDAVSEEYTKTDSILEGICGQKTTVARTPYGSQDDTVLSAIGKPCFMWSIDTLDWKTLNADNTVQVATSEASDGSIILMHDIHEPSVDAAETLIPKLQEAGYKLVTVSQLAKAKGVTLQDGKSYTDFNASTVEALLGSSNDESSSDSEGSDVYDDYTSDNSSTSDDESEDSSEDTSDSSADDEEE